jgi:chromosome segregation ATPase
MQLNINDQVLTLRAELKAHERTLHTFDKKVDRLEQAYEHHSDKLDEIENKIGDIDKSLKNILDLISQHKGSTETKAKIKNNIYMVSTLIITFTAAFGELIWKSVGR